MTAVKRFELAPRAFIPWSRLPITRLCPSTLRGHLCNRPRGHGGRHALIDYYGGVWEVWGDDVHAAKRPVVLDVKKGSQRAIDELDHVHHIDGSCFKRRNGPPCGTTGKRAA